MYYIRSLINIDLKVPERYEKCLWVSFSVKGKPLPPPSGREWATSWTANLGGGRMNPGIRILPLPSSNGRNGGRMRGRGEDNFLYLGWETILEG